MLGGKSELHPDILPVLEGFVLMAHRCDTSETLLSEQGKQDLLNQVIFGALVKVRSQLVLFFSFRCGKRTVGTG
ncbi:hypothetical protein D3C87_1903490 [compost metagenome]